MTSEDTQREDRKRQNREVLKNVLGSHGGRQIGSTTQLRQLMERLPALPLTIDPLLRGSREAASVHRTVAVRATVAVVRTGGPGQPVDVVPAVELFGLAADVDAFPVEIPHKVTLSPVDDCAYAQDLHSRGRQGEGLVVLAQHLFDIAEQIYDQPDLPEGSPEEREARDIAALIHEQVSRLEKLAPKVQAANLIADAFYEAPTT